MLEFSKVSFRRRIGAIAIYIRIALSLSLAAGLELAGLRGCLKSGGAC